MPLVRALAAVLLALPAVGGRAQAPSAPSGARFGIGDSRDRVRAIQGRPLVIERLASLGSETWSWRSATVRFAPESGIVIGWHDSQRELKVRARSGGVPTANRQLALGSSAADVLRLLGQPVAAALSGDREIWSYFGARATIAIDSSRRTVVAWRDPDRHMPAVESDRDAAERAPLTGRDDRQRTPRGVPVLDIAVALRDTAAATRAAGALNVLLLTITNRGDGSALTVVPYALVSPVGGAGAHAIRTAPIASILPGQSVTREAEIRFPASLSSDRVVLRAGANEQNGYGVAPEVRIELPVVPSHAPRLVAIGIEQDDQSGDGRVSPREAVDLRVRLVNVGAGDLSGASALLSLGRDVFAAAGTPSRLELPRMRPGDSADVNFSVYTNARAESVSVRVRINDAAGREVLGVGVPLRLTGRTAPTGDVRTPTGRAPADSDEVDAPFRSRAPINPDAVAVVFGVDYYRSLPRARFAARDAATMRQYVTGVFGVPNDGDHLLLRMDGDATLGEFRRVFGEAGWLTRRVRPQSDVIVYFAGHGASDSNGTPLLLPFDADVNYLHETAVQLMELYAALAKLPARRIVVMIDACFSGVSRGGVSLSPGARPIVVSIEHPALLRSGMAVFAAAQGAQMANELPERQHGLFSYQLFRALRGESDANEDSILTVDEIDRFVTRETRIAASRRDREQIPLAIARDRSLPIARLLSAAKP